MNEEPAVRTELDIEREELNLLIQRGVRFDVTRKVRRRKKGILGLYKKWEVIEETTSYELHEPTLSTLDRISEIGLEMAIDEEEFKGNVMAGAKRLVNKYARKMAEVLAIAVLGENYYITEISQSGRVTYHTNDKEVKRLADIFYHSIKPSKLALYTAMFTSVSNLADFTTSMRLVSGARTTKPITGRIE